MAKIKEEELHKHTLNLRKGDMEALETLFPKFPPSVMVRRIVSRFVDKTVAVPEEEIATNDLKL